MKNFSVKEFFEDKSFDDYKKSKWTISSKSLLEPRWVIDDTQIQNVDPDWIQEAVECLTVNINRDILYRVMALANDELIANEALRVPVDRFGNEEEE